MKSNWRQAAAAVFLPLALGACATAPASQPVPQARPLLQTPPLPISDEEAVILTTQNGVLCARRTDKGFIATAYARELANGAHRVNTAIVDTDRQVTFGYWNVESGAAEGFFASRISLKDARARYDNGNPEVDLEPAMDDAIRRASHALFFDCGYKNG